MDADAIYDPRDGVIKGAVGDVFCFDSWPGEYYRVLGPNSAQRISKAEGEAILREKRLMKRLGILCMIEIQNHRKAA